MKKCERRATREEEHDVGIEQAARENAGATQASLLVATTEEADAALQAAVASEDLENIVSMPYMEFQWSL